MLPKWISSYDTLTGDLATFPEPSCWKPSQGGMVELQHKIDEMAAVRGGGDVARWQNDKSPCQTVVHFRNYLMEGVHTRCFGTRMASGLSQN